MFEDATASEMTDHQQWNLFLNLINDGIVHFLPCGIKLDHGENVE